MVILCHRPRNTPLGKHVRGALVASLECLIPTVCKLPAFLTQRTVALQGIATDGPMADVQGEVECAQLSEAGNPLTSDYMTAVGSSRGRL